MQHGVGERGCKSVVTGELVAGPDTLPEENSQRTAPTAPAKPSGGRLIDDYYARAPPDFDADRGAAAVGRQLGRHGPASRAAISKAICAPARKQKWLEVHGDTHFTHFYSSYGEALAEALLRPFSQRRGHRLGQAAARVAQYPPPRRKIRAARRKRMAARAHAMDQIFPAARIGWARHRHASTAETTLSYETTGDGLTFRTPPMTA